LNIQTWFKLEPNLKTMFELELVR